MNKCWDSDWRWGTVQTGSLSAAPSDTWIHAACPVEHAELSAIFVLYLCCGEWSIIKVSPISHRMWTTTSHCQTTSHASLPTCMWLSAWYHLNHPCSDKWVSEENSSGLQMLFPPPLFDIFWEFIYIPWIALVARRKYELFVFGGAVFLNCASERLLVHLVFVKFTIKNQTHVSRCIDTFSHSK